MSNSQAVPDTETLTGVPLAEPVPIAVPQGYEDALARADQALALGCMLGVDRYDVAVPDHWVMPESVAAWEEGREEDLRTCVELDGETVTGISILSKRSPSATPHSGGRRAGGRGKIRGISKQSSERKEKAIRDQCPSPGNFAGRLMAVTLSPGHRHDPNTIDKMMRAMRAILQSIWVKKGIASCIAMAFSKSAIIPHYHLLFFLPVNRSPEACKVIAAQLKVQLDREWRTHNKFGIMKDAWELKETPEAARNAVAYICRHETNDKAEGTWGRPWFIFGEIPKAPPEAWEVTPRQYKLIWASLAAMKLGKKEHPWATKFAFADVDPRVFLMLLLRAGVAVTEDQIERYRVAW